MLVALGAILAGCTTTLRNQELERVAKDWALVIRASQVVPVYPLTEDLQPGDVLLVTTPVEEQAEIYEEKGFLPLDQHLVRLFATDLQAPHREAFAHFYDGRYETAAGIPPREWASRDEGAGGWAIAPRAAFPSYSFDVDSGGGLDLALPIQGVPFALGLMGSGRASGSVTLAEAYTYGLDNQRLERAVRAWGDAHRDLLSAFAPREPRTRWRWDWLPWKTYSGTHFLRVVTRVYLVGTVNVAIHNDEATSAEAAAGADRPLRLLGIKEGATAENFSKAMEAINGLAATQLPGAKVRFASASSRSVTMSETFEHPLVVGYVGFDLPILEGGRLGQPISTLGQLAGRRLSPTVVPASVFRVAAFTDVHEELKSLARTEGEAAAKARTVLGELDTLASLLPSERPFSLWESSGRSTEIVEGAPVEREGFADLLNYLGHAQTTIATLEALLESAPREGVTASRRELREELEAARTALARMNGRLRNRAALARAVDLALFGR